jgi:hypothetical protein
MCYSVRLACRSVVNTSYTLLQFKHYTPVLRYTLHYTALQSAHNRFCNPGYYSSTCQGSVLCLPCETGYYCSGGCTAPVPCPAGTARSTVAAVNATDCAACTAGSYAPAPGTSVCALCPAGYKCATASGVPVACAVGQYSGAGVTACTACATGTYAASE